MFLQHDGWHNIPPRLHGNITVAHVYSTTFKWVRYYTYVLCVMWLICRRVAQLKDWPPYPFTTRWQSWHEYQSPSQMQTNNPEQPLNEDLGERSSVCNECKWLLKLRLLESWSVNSAFQRLLMLRLTHKVSMVIDWGCHRNWGTTVKKAPNVTRVFSHTDVVRMEDGGLRHKGKVSFWCRLLINTCMNL